MWEVSLLATTSGNKGFYYQAISDVISPSPSPPLCHTYLMEYCNSNIILLLYMSVDLPHTVKMQYVHFRSHTDYFVLPWKIPEEIGCQSVLFHN